MSANSSPEGGSDDGGCSSAGYTTPPEALSPPRRSSPPQKRNSADDYLVQRSPASMPTFSAPGHRTPAEMLVMETEVLRESLQDLQPSTSGRKSTQSKSEFPKLYLCSITLPSSTLSSHEHRATIESPHRAKGGFAGFLLLIPLLRHLQLCVCEHRAAAERCLVPPTGMPLTSPFRKEAGTKRLSDVMEMGHDVNMDGVNTKLAQELQQGDSVLTPDVSSSKGVERQGELPSNLSSATKRHAHSLFIVFAYHGVTACLSDTCAGAEMLLLHARYLCCHHRHCWMDSGNGGILLAIASEFKSCLALHCMSICGNSAELLSSSPAGRLLTDDQASCSNAVLVHGCQKRPQFKNWPYVSPHARVGS